MEYKFEFKEHYSKLTDWDEYWNTIKEFVPQSIRVNTLKISVAELKKRLVDWKLKKIPWTEDGFWIYGERRDLGNLYEHKLGYFYCQEACSMIPALALKPSENDLILDMCAAPGSKTEQLCQDLLSTGKQVYTFESEKESVIARAGAVPITVDHLVSQITKKLRKPVERDERSG